MAIKSNVFLLDWMRMKKVLWLWPWHVGVQGSGFVFYIHSVLRSKQSLLSWVFSLPHHDTAKFLPFETHLSALSHIHSFHLCWSVSALLNGCSQVSAPIVPSATQEKAKDSDQFEWVTIEQSGELVYEAPESIATEPPPINKQQSQSSSSSSSSVQTMSPIPAHSLAAFGLFLRLPGYAEVLLKERKHAQCLLRLVLGVTDDGEGSKSESTAERWHSLWLHCVAHV